MAENTGSLEDIAKALRSISGFQAAEKANVDKIQDAATKKLAGEVGEIDKEFFKSAKNFLKHKEKIADLIEVAEEDATEHFVFKDDALDALKKLEAKDPARAAAKQKVLDDLNAAATKLAELEPEHRAPALALEKKIGGLTGMVNTEGLWGAVKTHVNPTEGRQAIAFGRIGGTAVCAMGLADGLFRDKTNNGEERSVNTRFGEVALCALGAAALLLIGKGHLNDAGKAFAKA